MHEPVLRVGLAQDRERAVISLLGPYTLEGRIIGPIEALDATVAEGAVRLAVSPSEIITMAPEVRLEPAHPSSAFILRAMTIGADFHWHQEQDLTFHGGLHFLWRGQRFDVINRVGLEAYLASVVSSEMSARCPPAMLRAHAIISRSWLLAQLEGGVARKKAAFAPKQVDGALELIRWYDREDHTHFDVCADDHCQRYQGITRTSTAAAAGAVALTRGLVLTFQGRVCDARFSKACGGMTEIFRSAWGQEDVPYLKSFPDRCGAAAIALPLTDEADAVAFIESSPPAWCNTSDRTLLEKVLPAIDHATTKFYRWDETVEATSIRTWVLEKAGVDLGQVTELRPLVRGPSGRIVLLDIVGERGRLRAGKELEIRRLLSTTHLYSSAFTVRAEGTGLARRFHLRGAGWGHGVGLCQIGAAVMAEQGYDHEAILAHYYRGTKLEHRY